MIEEDGQFAYSWDDIESELDNLMDVTGGFSPARRGLLKLKGGENIFVKIGLHEHTQKWANREIKVYDYLIRQQYPYIPQPLLTNSDDTAFALEALTTKQGWDWQDNWNEERLDDTLEALDALAMLKPKGKDREFFSQEQFGQDDNGWVALAGNTKIQAALRRKLRATGFTDLAEQLHIKPEAEKSRKFKFANNALTHYDIRADNCAWNAKKHQVKIVDWNWTCLGDRRVDLAAMLTHVHKSGFDVLPKYWSRLDSEALHWLAGFWLNAAARPIWPGGPEHLRDMQLLSGVTALKLIARLK